MVREDSIKQKFFQAIVRSWWVVVFFLFSFVVYDQSIKAKNSELLALQCRFESICDGKEKLLLEKEDLQSRIASCQDSSFVEQLLIKELGVVPKGYMKVYFKKEG